MTSPSKKSSTPNSPADPSTPSQFPTTTSQDWELVRRSIAMLPPGSWAMRREPALQVLSALVEASRRERHRDADHSSSR